MQEHVFELFSFSIKCVARWGCDIFSLTSLTMKKVRGFLFTFQKKKQVLLKSKSLPLKTIRVLQRILTIFVKSKELSTASPNFRREQALAHSCFLVFNQTRGKTRVWYFYSQVSQWRSYEFFFCFIFSFGEKKTGTDNFRSAKFDCPVIWKMNLTASMTCWIYT